MIKTEKEVTWKIMSNICEQRYYEADMDICVGLIRNHVIKITVH